MALNGTEIKLSAQQQTVLDTLMAGGSGPYAARISGVSLRTVRRWQASSDFQAAMAAATAAALETTCTALTTASTSAVLLLRAVIQDPAAQMSHRLRAATAVLDATLRWVELRSIVERLDRLEDVINHASD